MNRRAVSQWAFNESCSQASARSRSLGEGEIDELPRWVGQRVLEAKELRAKLSGRCDASNDSTAALRQASVGDAGSEPSIVERLNALQLVRRLWAVGSTDLAARTLRRGR